jgi:hypothetical protein
MINFTCKYNETECYLSREANITLDGEEYNIQYQVIIRMENGDCATPKVSEVNIEGIPDLDDYTYAPNLSDEETERRLDNRDDVYSRVKALLNLHYGVKP